MKHKYRRIVMIRITLRITQRIKKISENNIALHFVSSIFVKENPDTNLLSTSEKVKVKIHLVSMILFAWRTYISKEIIRLKREFEQSDNLK